MSKSYAILIILLLVSCARLQPQQPENNTLSAGFESASVANAEDDAYREITSPVELDFSRVGYHWGDDELPVYDNVFVTLHPSGDDDSGMIQEAIDSWGGSKGVILLSEGVFKVSSPIRLRKSSLVLRGTKSPDGDLLTTILKTGTAQEDVVNLSGEGYSSMRNPLVCGVLIPDHTPLGAMYVRVENAASFVPGMRVSLVMCPNDAWIKDLRMTAEDGLVMPWVPEEHVLEWERTVIKVDGEKVYLDNPVVMPLDKKYGESCLMELIVSNRITESGIEDLVIDTEFNTEIIEEDYYSFDKKIYADEDHALSAVKITGAEHCWVRGVTGKHMYFATVQFGTDCRNCTALDCNYLEPVSRIQGSRRYSYTMGNGQLCLVKGCASDQARHAYVVTGGNSGPNVFTQSRATNSFSSSGPHNHWSSGILFDCLDLKGWSSGEAGASPSAGTDWNGPVDRWFGLLQIQDAYNSGSSSSQGWVGSNSVMWNCESDIYVCQNPWVSSQNWAWGCKGTYKYSSIAAAAEQGRPQGDIRSPGEHIILDNYTSLYEYQLASRKERGDIHFIPDFNYQ